MDGDPPRSPQRFYCPQKVITFLLTVGRLSIARSGTRIIPALSAVMSFRRERVNGHHTRIRRRRLISMLGLGEHSVFRLPK